MDRGHDRPLGRLHGVQRRPDPLTYLPAFQACSFNQIAAQPEKPTTGKCSGSENRRTFQEASRRYLRARGPFETGACSKKRTQVHLRKSQLERGLRRCHVTEKTLPFLFNDSVGPEAASCFGGGPAGTNSGTILGTAGFPQVEASRILRVRRAVRWPSGRRRQFAKAAGNLETGRRISNSRPVFAYELDCRWVLLHRCWTASGHTLGHSGVGASGVAAARQQLSLAINSVTCQRQMRKYPLPETGDWQLRGALLGNVDSGCVPEVSLPTFRAGGTR